MKRSFFNLLSVKVDYEKKLSHEEFVRDLRDQERIIEIRSVLKVIANSMAIPLYLLFWISDIIYVPQLKWEFLAVRILIIPLCFSVQYLAARAKTFIEAQWVAFMFNGGMALAINYMIFRIGNPATSYYAGLNLVALGNLAFIPWTTSFYGLVTFVIFGPFYIITLCQIKTQSDAAGLFLNSFFIISTILMLFFIRLFNEALRHRELGTRIELKNEIVNRDGLIKEKSGEAIKLAALSTQFSPQVVEGIRSGKIDLKPGVHRANICALFIDIVNSTERVTRVDKDKINRAISMFMEDSIKTLLKYDITIDKFMGDGVLAFSNDPVQYDDYVERTLKAALEIRQKVANREDLYIASWMNKLELRFGIAVGFANVGFYGDDRYYKSYTAIGPVMNLANRLCGTANPNQIVISSDVADAINHDDFSLKSLGKKTLKGFESDIIHIFEVNAPHGTVVSTEEIDCPSCEQGLLYLESDSRGIFIMKCRSCGFVPQTQVATRKTSNEAA